MSKSRFKNLFLIASMGLFSSSIGHNNQNIQNNKNNNLKRVLKPGDEWSEFTGFIHKFEKKYESLHVLEKRFEIFKQNIRNIFEHNLRSEQNFTMGINQFTDLTPEEFKVTYANGLNSELRLGGKPSCKTYTPSGKVVPDYWDWRDKGAVTPVKNQGQ
jgi:hypothetical protein